MHTPTYNIRASFVFLFLAVLLLTSCAPAQSPVTPLPTSASVQTGTATAVPTKAATATAVTRPEWFDMKLTDVQTGKTFTINDYAGKVVLVNTMAAWCPTCTVQAAYIYHLRDRLGNPNDLVLVSLDTDLNEDATILKKSIAPYAYDWHFAVAPIEVDRALGNLYNAQYLNPPLEPMLIIDRDGSAHQLEFGLKDTEALQKALEPYFAK